jgi:NADH-quinone oxidoreductase subunit I
MPIHPDDVDWVEEPPMNFWETTFLPAVVDGLFATGHHVTHFKSVTQQYPEVASDLPKHYRGVHRLNRDDAGRVKCVACMMCATACPARCIDIVAQEAPKDDPKWVDRDKFPNSFVIDELKCIYCGMCEEACPVDAIELTHIYDLVGLSRQEMLFDKEKLLSVFDQTKDSGLDPIRTHKGRLGPASDFEQLPTLGPATTVREDDRSARANSPGVIRG